jgi:hypothetical protein
MNSNIKGIIGCSSNMNTSTSLLRMAKGSNWRISMFENDAHRSLQTTSLCSKLKIKDTILKNGLHICNQNFDKRKYFCCVQFCEDSWMTWNFYNNPSEIWGDIEEMVPKFLNVYHVCLKRLRGVPFLKCNCQFYERWVMVYSKIWIHMSDSMNWYVKRYVTTMRVDHMNSYGRIYEFILSIVITQTKTSSLFLALLQLRSPVWART